MFIWPKAVGEASWTRWYVYALCYNVQALWLRYAALCSFADINRSLSTVTLRGFRTLFDGEGCMMTEVSLWQVKPRPAGQSKWHEAWWKKNPRPSGRRLWDCIFLQFQRFFFHHASYHLLWPTGIGFTCPKLTSVIMQPSPSNKVRKPLRVAVERVRKPRSCRLMFLSLKKAWKRVTF